MKTISYAAALAERDRDVRENTYAEWLAVYNDGVASLRKEGMRLKRVDVRIGELEQWCRRHGRRPDGAARSEDAADVLRHLAQEGFALPDA